jgi:5-oxoprolinase (ATP-hydrolysing) subunit A
VAHTGEEVSIEAQTVCIHGDTPGATMLAKAVVQTLQENGIQITSVREVLGID